MSVGAVILFVVMLVIIGVLVSALGERDAEICRMRIDLLGKRVVGKSPWAGIPPLCGRQAGPRMTVGEPLPRPKWPRPPSAGSSMTPPPPLRLEVTP